MVVRNVSSDEGRCLLEMLEYLRQGAKGCAAYKPITVRILAAADHDGVCSAKILNAVLQPLGVKATIVPVTGNTEIIENLKMLGGDAEVRSLVLLNCGGSLDMQSELEDCGVLADLRCFIIDAHRPFLLENLSKETTRVVVLDDDPVAEERGIVPPVDEDSAGSEDDGSMSAGSDAEKENVWDPDAHGGISKAKDGATQERREKKRRHAEERQERLEKKRRKVVEYYESSYYATPAAMSIFKMAKQFAPPSQDLIWLAAVALNGYQELGLISDLEYGRMVWDELKEALDRTADAVPFSSQVSGNTMLDNSGQFSDDEDSAVRRPRPRIIPDKQGVRFELGLRLTLYKHWTLEESMMHSSYFYGSLELHRDKGVRAQKNFFAKAGISPSDFKQLYNGMDLRVRKTLDAKFRDHGKSYGLSNDKMFLDQFLCDLGPRGEMNTALHLNELSSSDAANIAVALLCGVAFPVVRTDQLPQTADGHRNIEAVEEIERQVMVDNFWRAYDVVVGQEPAPLKEGIAEAVAIAKAVQNLARLLIDTKALRLDASKQFNWCKVEQPPSIFRHHLALRRLAVWLLHVMYRYRPKTSDMNRSERGRPLLVAVRDAVRETYLCVGASHTPENIFGSRYRSVLRTDRSYKFRYDFFDKSCIEVAADDFPRFCETLVNSIS